MGEGECVITRETQGWGKRRIGGHGGKRQPGAGRGRVVNRELPRGWGLLGVGPGTLGLLWLSQSCPREGHSCPGPPKAGYLLVSWVEGLASHKAPGFSIHLGSYFSWRWDIVRGNMLRGTPLLSGSLRTGIEVSEGEACALGKGRDPGEKPFVLPLCWKSP